MRKGRDGWGEMEGEPLVRGSDSQWDNINMNLPISKPVDGPRGVSKAEVQVTGEQ